MKAFVCGVFTLTLALAIPLPSQASTVQCSTDDMGVSTLLGLVYCLTGSANCNDMLDQCYEQGYNTGYDWGLDEGTYTTCFAVNGVMNWESNTCTPDPNGYTAGFLDGKNTGGYLACNSLGGSWNSETQTCTPGPSPCDCTDYATQVSQQWCDYLGLYTETTGSGQKFCWWSGFSGGKAPICD